MLETLILDNYDSFTWNLYQVFAEFDAHPKVFRNDELTLEDIKKLNPAHIVISPGPGTVEKKEDFGICQDVILKFGQKIPVLGVCLGHQGIAYAFGAKIKQAPKILHGKVSDIEVNQKEVFKNCPKIIRGMRYHSLIVDENSLPWELEITARTRSDRTIMGLKHKKFPLFGVQFHPESFATPWGKQIIKNFLNIQNVNAEGQSLFSGQLAQSGFRAKQISRPC